MVLYGDLWLFMMIYVWDLRLGGFMSGIFFQIAEKILVIIQVWIDIVCFHEIEWEVLGITGM